MVTDKNQVADAKVYLVHPLGTSVHVDRSTSEKLRSGPFMTQSYVCQLHKDHS